MVSGEDNCFFFFYILEEDYKHVNFNIKIHSPLFHNSPHWLKHSVCTLVPAGHPAPAAADGVPVSARRAERAAVERAPVGRACAGAAREWTALEIIRTNLTLKTLRKALHIPYIIRHHWRKLTTWNLEWNSISKNRRFSFQSKRNDDSTVKTIISFISTQSKREI